MRYAIAGMLVGNKKGARIADADSGADKVQPNLAGDSSPSNAGDVSACDTKIVKFARGHAAQLGDRLTILAPIVERACYVHDKSPFRGLSKLSCQSLALCLLR